MNLVGVDKSRVNGRFDDGRGDGVDPDLFGASSIARFLVKAWRPALAIE